MSNAGFGDIGAIPGSTWTNGHDLYVGREGTGTLNIQNGGAVTVDADLYIKSLGTLDILLASTSDPLLDVAGNTSIDGSLGVALAEAFALNQGEIFTLIDMTNSASTLTGTFTGLGEDESVGNFGGLDLFISYVGGDGNDVTLYSILDLDIDIRPGNEQNPVNLRSNGVLPVALFGETDFDVYNIDLSSLSLEGAVPKQSGNSPKVGSYKDINGDDLIDLLLHFDLGELDVDASATELVLEGELNNEMAFNVSDTIRLVGPGDVNADGVVDGVVFWIWQPGYPTASGASLSDGDADGDGDVDGIDFGIWQANYPTNVSGAATIPEPATLGLLLLGGLVLLRRRH